MKKTWTAITALATMLALFTIACLLILYAFDPDPVGTAPPAMGPSYEAAGDPVRSDAAAVERAPAEHAPRALAARQRAEPAPAEPAAPRPAELTAGESGAPYRDPDDPTADQTSASEQVVFKSRRALETVDPREFLREGAFPPN